ncbi:MAG: DotU family type IV/VI secretion system protein [Bryobacterales bacterium]|nr:DotU family type IV/VI secretion system protein [Bryobacterales bacterium]
MSSQSQTAARHWQGLLARPENMALAFQEVFTVVARLKGKRQQVTNAEQFRGIMREALKRSKENAKRSGYGEEECRLAEFAMVALLDESILNSGNPVFNDWPRRPLQEEFYGHHTAGEFFFQYLRNLLNKPDSEEVNDVLEVYHLALAMGFRGRYGLSGGSELANIMNQIEEKRNRIRPFTMLISPESVPAGDVAPRKMGDPWLKPLLFSAIGLFALVAILFAVYWFVLDGGAGDLRALTATAAKS